MEQPSERFYRNNKAPYSSPQKLLPVLNYQNPVVVYRKLSWLRSIPKSVSSNPPAIKNGLAIKMRRTPAHQIKLEIEELDQENWNLNKELTTAKKVHEVLTRKFQEERKAFDALVESFNAVSRIGHHRGRSGQRPLKNNSSEPKPLQLGVRNHSIQRHKQNRDYEHKPPQIRIQSQSDGPSQILQSPTSALKTPKRILMADKECRISTHNLTRQENVFEIAKTDKKKFEAVIREILTDSSQHPASNDHILKCISLLNFHVSELEKRIFKRHRSSKYYQLIELRLSNCELSSEIARLSELYTAITEDAKDKTARAVPRLKSENYSLQEKIGELDEMIKFIEREIHYVDGEIHCHELEIKSLEQTLEKSRVHNKTTAGEIGRCDSEINELLAKISDLTKL
jgi:hypothetical protein